MVFIHCKALRFFVFVFAVHSATAVTETHKSQSSIANMLEARAKARAKSDSNGAQVGESLAGKGGPPATPSPTPAPHPAPTQSPTTVFPTPAPVPQTLQNNPFFVSSAKTFCVPMAAVYAEIAPAMLEEKAVPAAVKPRRPVIPSATTAPATTAPATTAAAPPVAAATTPTPTTSNCAGAAKYGLCYSVCDHCKTYSACAEECDGTITGAPTPFPKGRYAGKCTRRPYGSIANKTKTGSPLDGIEAGLASGWNQLQWPGGVSDAAASGTVFQFNYNNVEENTEVSGSTVFYTPDEFSNVQILHECANTEFGSTGVVSSTAEATKTQGTMHSETSGASAESLGMGIGAATGGEAGGAVGGKLGASCSVASGASKQEETQNYQEHASTGMSQQMTTTGVYKSWSYESPLLGSDCSTQNEDMSNCPVTECSLNLDFISNVEYLLYRIATKCTIEGVVESSSRCPNPPCRCYDNTAVPLTQVSDACTYDIDEFLLRWGTHLVVGGTVGATSTTQYFVSSNTSSSTISHIANSFSNDTSAAGFMGLSNTNAREKNQKVEGSNNSTSDVKIEASNSVMVGDFDFEFCGASTGEFGTKSFTGTTVPIKTELMLMALFPFHVISNVSKAEAEVLRKALYERYIYIVSLGSDCSEQQCTGHGVCTLHGTTPNSWGYWGDPCFCDKGYEYQPYNPLKYVLVSGCYLKDSCTSSRTCGTLAPTPPTQAPTANPSAPTSAPTVRPTYSQQQLQQQKVQLAQELAQDEKQAKCAQCQSMTGTPCDSICG